MEASPLARRQLGSLGIFASELCLGTVTFGGQTDEQTAAKVLGRYLDAGGNLIDTADVYGDGRAEEILGKTLGSSRDAVLLATKGGMPVGSDPNARGASRRHLLAAVEGSLRRLNTDWIDLYQVHLPDPFTQPEETLRALDDLIRSGKVRYIGASNYTGWQLARSLGVSDRLGLARFASLEAQYSLVSRDLELDLLPLCEAESLAVMAWGPLGGGILSGKYVPNTVPPEGTRLAESPETAHAVNARTSPIIDEVLRVARTIGRTAAQVALKWVLGQPRVASAIVSARTTAQLTDNLGVMGWELPTEYRRTLDRVSRPRLTYPHDLQRMLGARL